MTSSIYSVIIGTGSYIPTKEVTNQDFKQHTFYHVDGKPLDKTTEEIVEKCSQITGIAVRRHITDDLVNSDIGYYAAKDGLQASGIDKESLDYIIFAHNFGDVKHGTNRSDLVPSLASRVKHKLKIENPNTIPHDVPFGCPGWLHGMIQADYYIKSGDVKRILVIGADTLSRIADPYDRDSLLYADGAGAAIIEAVESDAPTGILAHKTRSDSIENAYTLRMGKSYNPDHDSNDSFLKMDGHKLYKYVLEYVPQIVKDCLDQAGVSIEDVDKFLFHQANGKMDEAILRRIYGLCGEKDIPSDVMPMTVSWLGNSSVATVPTLLDLLLRGKLDTRAVKSGSVLVLVSFGAGVNVNAMVYKIP